MLGFENIENEFSKNENIPIGIKSQPVLGGVK